MTREEAIRELKQFSGTTQLRLSANFWEALNRAIKLLEQEPTTKNNLEVDKTDMIDKPNFSQEQYKADLQSAYDCGKPILDKIRAEIKALPNANPSYWYSGDIVDRDDVLEIIDEYRAESEGE